VSDLIHDPTLTYQSTSRSARSFKGAIDAVNQLRSYQDLPKLEFDDNWNGLIKAILSLKSLGGSPIGDLPPSWEIIIDPETGNPIGGIQGPVEEGQLWFDSRQGRLFIWVGDGWFQTNGADGLTAVQEEPPEGPPIGSYWYNTTNGVLYLWDGDSWEAVGGGSSVTTQSLPLAEPVTDAFRDLRETVSLYPEPNNLIFQSDANHYFVTCLDILDREVSELKIPDKPTVTVGDNPPADPDAGMLWFDSKAIDLLVYYDDGQTQQWVPTTAHYIIDTKVNELEADLNEEIQNRVSAVASLRTALTLKQESNLSKIQTLENQHITLSNRIDHMQSPDLSAYSTTAELNQALLDLTALVVAAEAKIPSVQGLATEAYVQSSVQSLSASVASTYATTAQIADVQAEIPYVGDFVTDDDLAHAINGVTTGYLATTGGVVDGNLVLNNNDVSKAGIDFSSMPVHSKYAMSFKTNGPGLPLVSFGTNNEYYEYAWDFTSNEDFCWKHNGNKVVSIASDGLVATSLKIGQFQPNSLDGRRVMNTIDVAQEIADLKAEVAQLKAALQ
jgi:hypothetical protein